MVRNQSSAWICHLKFDEAVEIPLQICMQGVSEDYLTTSKRIDLCIETKIAVRAHSLLHAKYESVEMYFAFLTKGTALLFDPTHGRQVSNKS
jgi:hypothetical protein